MTKKWKENKIFGCLIKKEKEEKNGRNFFGWGSPYFILSKIKGKMDRNFFQLTFDLNYLIIFNFKTR